MRPRRCPNSRPARCRAPAARSPRVRCRARPPCRSWLSLPLITAAFRVARRAEKRSAFRRTLKGNGEFSERPAPAALRLPRRRIGVLGGGETALAHIDGVFLG